MEIFNPRGLRVPKIDDLTPDIKKAIKKHWAIMEDWKKMDEQDKEVVKVEFSEEGLPVEFEDYKKQKIELGQKHGEVIQEMSKVREDIDEIVSKKGI